MVPPIAEREGFKHLDLSKGPHLLGNGAFLCDAQRYVCSLRYVEARALMVFRKPFSRGGHLWIVSGGPGIT